MGRIQSIMSRIQALWTKFKALWAESKALGEESKALWADKKNDQKNHNKYKTGATVKRMMTGAERTNNSKETGKLE